MALILIIAWLSLLYWITRRARERAAEYAAAGLSRSPLYLAANVLMLVLLAVVPYVGHVHRQGPVPALLWGAVLALVVVLLVLRQALKRRYSG